MELCLKCHIYTGKVAKLSKYKEQVDVPDEKITSNTVRYKFLTMILHE
jgi:hypothetical protein